MEGVECVQADIADLEAIKPAFEGVDVVAHMAAYLGDDSFEGQLPVNVIGAYNVYEAARLAGVKRVVFASSGATARGFETEPPYDAIAQGRFGEVPEDFPKITHEQTWPGGIYGATKIWGEVLGRHFSDAYGMSVLCVRIGRVNEANRPEIIGEVCRYLSHPRHRADAAEMHRRPPTTSSTTSSSPSPITGGGTVTSSTRRGVLGYAPQDSAEQFSLPQEA